VLDEFSPGRFPEFFDQETLASSNSKDNLSIQTDDHSFGWMSTIQL